MSKKNKIILIMSIISVILILVLGSTFAFFMWTTDKEALVDVAVSSGSGSCTLVNDNQLELIPTYSKYHGREIILNARQDMAEKAYIVWTLTVSQINGLQNNKFMYELVNKTTGESYGSGNFGNITATEGSNTITFSNENEVLGYNKDYEFALYLWIDGTIGENPISMSDQTFNFDMSCSITGTDQGTVIGQNILMIVEDTQSAQLEFLRGDKKREQISSVTFVDNATIPSDAIDVSKNEDNSVMLWYVENNGLYDAYIGSDNGKVIVEDGKYLFSYLTNATSIDISNINSSYLTSMYSMFSCCYNLTSINFGDIDTSDVTSMFGTFGRCNKLASLDLSGFNTSNVTKMGSMFYNCSSLTELDLGSFDTSNVTSMAQMFQGCSGLTSLNLNSFDTGNVTIIGAMFALCSNLTELDLSHFDTSKATNMLQMFYKCHNLVQLDVSSFDTSNVTKMNSMFSECTNLVNLNLSNFDTGNVKEMQYMFSRCSNLKKLDISGFNTTQVTNMEAMFNECSSLVSLDLKNFKTPNVNNMMAMFNLCVKLESLDVSNFNTAKVTTMFHMFSSCYELTNLNLSSFTTNALSDMSYMFAGCTKLNVLNISKFDKTNIQNIEYMLSNVPDNCNIIVKDSEHQNWIKTNYPNLNNIDIL